MISQLEALKETTQETVLTTPATFHYELTDCVESVGVGLVSTVQAQHLLPAEFSLAGKEQPVTPLVVLAVRCKGISVDGSARSPGSIVQVGLAVVPPDGTGEVNVFTLWHFTTHPLLARTLRRCGIQSQVTPEMNYDVMVSGEVGSVRIDLPSHELPEITLSGTVSQPNQALSFAGNWWAKRQGALIKLASHVPNGLIGESELSLTTSHKSPLSQLIGGSTLSFPVLQRYNTFQHANTQMSVLATK